ncbi:MFS transporter [Actinomycetes bacterium KLBMP 9759]
MITRLGPHVAAAVLVRIADEGARVALILLALQRTGSPALGGALVAALLVPHVVAAPLTGARADRSTRPHLVVASLTLLFAAGLVAVDAATGRLPFPAVVLIALIVGCCGPAVTGALSSLLSTLVPTDRLPRASGADALSYTIAGMAGPALAGAVAQVTSPSTAVHVLAGAAAAGAAVIALLPVPHRQPEPAPDGALRISIRAITRDRLLATTTWSVALAQIGIGALPLIAAALAARHGFPALTGYLLTASAAGALVGSLLWTVRPASERYVPVAAMAGLAGTGLPLVVAAAFADPAAIGVLFGVSGAFTGASAAAVFVVRHRAAPAAARSQVFTLAAGIKTSAAAAGAALAGVAAGAPIGLQLAGAGAVPIVAGVLGLFRTRGSGSMATPHQ